MSKMVIEPVIDEKAPEKPATEQQAPMKRGKPGPKKGVRRKKDKTYSTLAEAKAVGEPKGLIPFNLQALMAAAIEQGSGMETLERLTTLRRELEQEEARKAYFRALSRFQGECPPIVKDMIVWNKQTYGKDGVELPLTVRYSYATIDAIVAQTKAPLANNGLSMTFNTRQTADSLTGIFLGHHIDGHSETTEITVPIMASGYMNATQEVKSARTYALRIVVSDGLGIACIDSDDDGRSATPQPEDQPKTRGGRKPPKNLQPLPPKPGELPDPPPLQQLPPVNKIAPNPPPVADPEPQAPIVQPELAQQRPEEPQYTAAQVQAYAEKCRAGIKVMISQGIIKKESAEQNYGLIIELENGGKYLKLKETLKDLVDLYNRHQPGGKK